MQPSLSAHPNQRPTLKRPFFTPKPLGKPSKWYLPTMAAIALGFGVSNYYSTLQQRQDSAQEEAERLRRNQQLMDAYGDKDNLHDIERALAVYEIQ